jgi:glycosyltransferase involved in cell wall biosynthesis
MLNNEVSVVIPTLGGEVLKETINKLNSGTLVPKEILLVVPEYIKYNIQSFKHNNVKVIRIKKQGQVKQRAYGFKKTNYDLVLQLDDDVWLNNTCLEKLVKSILNQNDKCSIAPKIIDRNKINNRNVISPFLNSKKQKYFGVVLKTGKAVSVPDYFFTDKLIEVQWIPGGCVLHKKKNLVLNNYFPYEGKAYCEDLIHSFLLREMKVKLLIDTSACCYTEIEGDQKRKIIDFFQELKKDFDARVFFMKSFQFYSNKIYFYYFYRILVYSFKRFILKFVN